MDRKRNFPSKKKDHPHPLLSHSVISAPSGPALIPPLQKWKLLKAFFLYNLYLIFSHTQESLEYFSWDIFFTKTNPSRVKISEDLQKL